MQKQRGFFYQVAVASTALTLSFVAIAGASSVMVRKNIGESFGTAIAQSATFLKDLSDVSDSLAPSNGQVLTFSGGQWNAASPGSFSENDTLADVTGRGATTTATITATGFIGSGAGLTGLPAPTNGASLTSLPSLGLHSDVTLTTPMNGQILSFNGTDWVNSTPATVSESDTLATVTGRGASTSANLTLNGTLTLGGNVTATGQTITAGTFSGAHSGSGTGLTSLPSIDALSDVTAAGLTSGDNGKVLTFNNVTGWTAQSPASVTETDPRLPPPSTNGNVLTSNGSAWTSASIPTCTGSNKALQFNGTAWSCATITVPAVSVGTAVTRSFNTNYTATSAGMVTAYSLAGSAGAGGRIRLIGKIDGTTVAYDYAMHDPGQQINQAGSITFAVASGQVYRVDKSNDTSGGYEDANSMIFVPFN